MGTEYQDHSSPEVQAEIANGIKSTVEIKPDSEKLRAYTQAKLAIADQLRIVREALTALGRENAERQCGELVVKLAEDRFIMAVLGQFKRGKSSLMNAIIGRELLPTGVLPLTSAITVLKYGTEERLVIRRENSMFQDELPLSALPDYVTEKGNPANQKKVKTASVELPVPFLRRGVEFVDTPGVGSAITTNTITTYSFLPECDAVLFVTSVDTPMTSLEIDFLKEIHEYVDKIFFVVNKTDLIAADERSEVLRFVIETIQVQIGHNAVRVFPVSARLGLEAKKSNDTALYEQSGIKALEETLAAFLSEEKATIFLATVAHKALRVLDSEEIQDAFGEAALQARIRALQEEKSVMVHRDLHTAVAAMMAARAKLETIHQSLLAGRMAEIPIMETSTVEVSAKTEAETSVAQTPAPPNLASDLHVRGCPVCKHIEESAFGFFAHWQYQIGTEERAQAEFAAELGFCPLHTWQLLSVSSPHGASIGFARLVEQIARTLRENPAAETGDAVRGLVRDSRNCRVCRLLHQAEEEYIHQLAMLVDGNAGWSQYSSSQGVCLRHLGMLLEAEAVSTAGSREFLLSHAAQRFEEDAEDMRSYALKREALRRQLQNRNEEDAYLRAIIRMVGGRNVNLPWAEDVEI